MCNVKRALTLAVCVLMALSMLVMGGCSTPDVALTVNDVTFEMGDYLAYLYNSYYNVYYNQYLYYYEQMGQNIMNQTFTYDEKNLKLDDYLKRVTVDTIIRQVAVSELLEEYNLSVDEEEIKEFDDSLAGMGDNTALDPMTGKSALEMGFKFERYAKVLKTYSLNESALFYGLYDKGGEREIAEDDIRTHFNENYLSYKIITVTLQDSEGADLSAEEQKEITDELKEYLTQYEQSGDFDAVIEQYKKDHEEETTSSTTGTGSSSATSSATSTTASTATTESETTTSTTAASDEGSGDNADGDTEDGEEEEEEKTDPNRVNTTVDAIGDEDFSNELKKVEIGTAKVITYKAGGKNLTAALVLRLDPEEGVGAIDYEDERRTLIYDIAFEEFDKEVQEKIETLTVVEDSRAIRMATIKNFR